MTLVAAAAGLLGNGVLQLLRSVAAAGLVQPGADVIPGRACLWAMGLEVLTGPVAGFDLGAADKQRCGCCSLLMLPHLITTVCTPVYLHMPGSGAAHLTSCLLCAHHL